MKTRTLLGLLVITTAITLPASAQKTARGGATVYDSQNAVPLLIRSDRLGAYPITIESAIEGTGTNIVISAGGGGKNPRKMTFDFREPYQGEGIPTFTPASVITSIATMRLRCDIRNVSVASMAQGEVAYCGLVTHFDYAGTMYRLGQNSQTPHTVPMQGEDAKITCTKNLGTGCTAWSIVPAGLPTLGVAPYQPDPNAKSLSILFNPATNEALGYFYMSFAIDVVK